MVAEQNNLHRALVRVGENAHRLALICAGSKRPSSPVIDEECAAWSIAFMRHFGLQLVHAIRSRMAGSDFERWVKAIYDFIARAGENGTNKSHMQQYCATYKALDQRQVAAVLDRLISSGMVEQRPGARKSVRYVAVDPNVDGDDC